MSLMNSKLFLLGKGQPMSCQYRKRGEI